MTRGLLLVQRELRAYFSTWSGYIIVALTLFVDGLLFNVFAIGSEAKFSATVLADFFYFASGVTMVAAIMLASRLLAEEKHTGTIVLFYTAPISERELVYGKFLSAFLFLSFMHLLSLYLPVLILINGKISIGHLAAGYLALSLLGAATLAMTLMCSALATNQLMAGVTSACLLVFMLIFWLLARVVEDPFRDLFSYLALHNEHFVSFTKGIVHSKHLIYYFSVLLFFLEATVRIVQTRRWQG